MDAFDLVVIGAGPGGYPAAIRAAQLGARVAIVEREAWGGTCLHWGCIPTKSLIAAGHAYQEARAAAAMGVIADGVRLDYGTALNHKKSVVKKLASGVQSLLKAHGIEMISGQASFAGPRRLSITRKGEDRRIDAKRIILATGSTSVMPGFLPRHPRVVESRAFLDLPELPRRIIVMGGGYIGCELACLAAALGAEVTVVELLEDILLLLDADARRDVRRNMEKGLGIRILTGQPLESPEASDAGVRVRAGGNTLEADLLLVSVGRRPVTEDLNLVRAGLKPDERGYVPVDSFNETSVAGIYAIGDVNGGPQLAHAAHAQGIIAAEHALGHRTRPNETLIPGVIFTTPEVAVVGLTEAEAERRKMPVRTGKFHYAALGRALAAGQGGGFVKWIVDPGTDRLLGATAVGAHATDLISEAALAIRNELTAREVGRTVHPHPTFGELWMEAAHAVHGDCIHVPPSRRRS